MHDANRRLQSLRVFAQGKRRNLRFTFVKRRLYRQISPDEAVCEQLRLLNLFARDGFIKVDRRIVQREMEADVARLKQVVEGEREQVFARVLLHKIKSPRPVDLARDGFADRERAIHAVINFSRFFAHVEDICPAQRAGVGGLPAAFGKEHGLIEHDVKLLSGGCAGENEGLCFLLVAVQIIQTLCHRLPQRS